MLKNLIDIVLVFGICYFTISCIYSLGKIIVFKASTNMPLSNGEKLRLFPYYEKIVRYGFRLIVLIVINVLVNYL